MSFDTVSKTPEEIAAYISERRTYGLNLLKLVVDRERCIEVKCRNVAFHTEENIFEIPSDAGCVHCRLEQLVVMFRTIDMAEPDFVTHYRECLRRGVVIQAAIEYRWNHWVCCAHPTGIEATYTSCVHHASA